ncbi:MAG: histidinol phosphate phosphatase [Tardiphaga sp.]|nr:histidinol phosphate phosphatase [Tardiphaga sp.]
MADRFDFEALSVEKLWNLYHDIRGVLTDKLSEQKRDLDNRLRSLSQQDIGQDTKTAEPVRPKQAGSKKASAKDGTRRAYPKVLPLYRNPSEPSETWSGRGNKPRWLAAQVNAGRDITDFLIKPPASRGAPKRKAGRNGKT